MAVNSLVPPTDNALLPTGANALYRIRKGDTLSQIAKQFNTTVEELVRLNQIKNPNKIGAGKTIVLTPQDPPPESGGPITRSLGGRGEDPYKDFPRGDSLDPDQGASRFGVTPAKTDQINPTSHQAGDAAALLKERNWREGLEGERPPQQVVEVLMPSEEAPELAERMTADMPQQRSWGSIVGNAARGVVSGATDIAHDILPHPIGTPNPVDVLVNPLLNEMFGKPEVPVQGDPVYEASRFLTSMAAPGGVAEHGYMAAMRPATSRAAEEAAMGFASKSARKRFQKMGGYGSVDPLYDDYLRGLPMKNTPDTPVSNAARGATQTLGDILAHALSLL